MAGKTKYTQEMIDEFIELAQVIGISPAVKQLGYPSTTWAMKWFDDAGIERPNVDSLAQKAAQLKHFYGDNEKKYGIQVLMESIVEMAQDKQNTADDVNKLSNAYAKLVQAYQLVEGKATNVNETIKKDGMDLEITKLTTQMEKLNAEKAKQYE